MYGKLAVAAALGLRSTLQLVEIQASNDFIVDIPVVNFSHRYSLQVSLKRIDIVTLKLKIAEFIP